MTNGHALHRAIDDLFDEEIETVKIPKFTYKNKLKISNMIKKVGFTEIFNAGNLMDMTDSKDIFVKDIYHEIVIIVDEAGSEATQTTLIDYDECIGSGDPIIKVKFKFIADHPFMFYIRYVPKNLILFTGIYS